MRKSRGEKIFIGVAFVTTFLFAFTTLYPFLHVMTISLSTNRIAFRGGLHFFPVPGEITFEAYRSLLSHSSVWWGYYNTIIVTFCGTALSLVVYSLFAYPLTKRNLPFRSFLNYFLMFTMLFNGGLIPTYLVVRSLGLLDTRIILILQGVVSAFNIFIIRNFFSNLPDEMEEAALIDGAGHFQTFIRIVIPLSKPVLTTIGLWVAIGHWNAWFASMIYIQTLRKQVLQVVLRNILILMSSDIASDFFKQATRGSELGSAQMRSALILIALVPILIVFPFVYKYFEKGIMIGSIKG